MKEPREHQPVELEIITVAVRPRIGGMTAWFEQIARGLASRGWRVRLVGITDRWGDYSRDPFEAIHIPASSPRNTRFSSAEKWWRWREVRKRFQTLMLNHHRPRVRLVDSTPGVLHLAHHLAKIDGVPWVVLAGGDIFKETEGSPFAGLFHNRIRRDLNAADRIWVDGPDLVESLSGRGVRRDLFRVCYHGIDLERWVSESGSGRYFEEEAGRGKFKLVWHGRLAEQHGPLRFVEIASWVDGAEARMCGGGEESETLKRRLEEIGKPEWWLGLLAEDELGGFLSEGDCGVYPLRETAGIPTVVLEAMSMGIPCLTYPVGAVGELIRHGENGFICRTPDEMVRTLESLRDDPNFRGQVGRRARKTIEDHWSVEATLDIVEKEFREILDR